jgi:monoterpene epsilon-lactone hydrolase
MKNIMPRRKPFYSLALIFSVIMVLQPACISQTATITDSPAKATAATNLPVSSSTSQNIPDGARVIPERVIPVPATASAELGVFMRAPINTNADRPKFEPKTAQDWKEYVKEADKISVIFGTGMLKSFPGKYENTTVAGVPVNIFTPDGIAQENADMILIHLHGGAFCRFGGVAGISEAIFMTQSWKIKIISVDYRMPPDYPFPAGLDDVVAVYKELIKTYKPENIGIFGTSAGGGLTLSTVLKLKDLGLPLPGAIAPGTPWSDLTKTGDTYYTNEFIDDTLVSYDGVLAVAALSYSGGHDLKEPLLSPVYGDFRGFPPTILTTGTRDLFLSNTVRVHRQLRKAGVEADIQIFEGMSHGTYAYFPNLPEHAEAMGEIVGFFDKHLGRQ